MFEFLNSTEGALKVYFDKQPESLETIVVALFTGINSIRIIAYLPQILKAARDSNGASAISCTTWGLFMISHLATILYAVVSLGDLIMAAVFFGNALACFVIIFVAIRKRRQFHLRNLQNP